jgi:hypothetical protein
MLMPNAMAGALGIALIVFGLAYNRIAGRRHARQSNQAAANRWPLCVLAFDDFHILPAAQRALASGR